MFHQFWRRVRQNCIFEEETRAFLEKNEFPRLPFSLKNRGFSTI